MDLRNYLGRIGYEGSVESSAEVLAALHKAHLAAIPFENLDILLGKPITLDLDGLQRKLVDERRGGYCFEQNTLFRAALEGMGFTVTSLGARVRAGGGTSVRPRTHMVLRVELSDEAFLVDVGFGGDGPLEPLPFVEGREYAAGGATHRLRREKELWVLEGRVTGEWDDLYAFTLEPQYPVDFVMANHFTSTYPQSIFVQSLTAQRVQSDRRTILRNRDFTILESGSRRNETVRDPDHLLEILRAHFDLSFPLGTRFRKPEF